tara:strand:- start:551 stop:805 length:255 start_codon:yes stop_codon:yes gene_type:complete
MDQRFKEINDLKNKKYNNMSSIQETSDQDNIKSELIADLLATSTVMEEVWKYHPDNPNGENIIEAYEMLKQIQKNIEKELEEIE